MDEAVLRDFFLGAVTASALRRNLQGGVERRENIHEHRITDMDMEFVVEPAHLVRLCDAVLAGELSPETLQQIGFCVIASDHFRWHAETPAGSLVGEALIDWSSPEINWPLTPDNVRRFREGLTTDRYILSREDSR